MSKVIGFVIGAVLIVAGILTGNVGLIIQGTVMIIAQAAVDLTMPKSPARQAAEMQMQLGEQPRSAMLGEAFVAGSLVDGFNYGGKYATDWEVLIIRLADHRCASLTSVIVNDEVHTFTGNGAMSGFSGQLEVYFRADTTATALPAVVTAHGPGWVSGDKGESGCDVVVAYKADAPDAKNPVWGGGRPRFGFVVKGKFCYDPLKDSTVSGGSGSHRWTDPSTWEWSDNPAVCRYNWERGIYANDAVTDPASLLIGRGLTEIEAPPGNIFAAANLCDELVGGEKRYRCGGPVYANQTYLEVEEMFAAATGGSVVTREGSVQLEPGAAKSIVASITDDDLLIGSQVDWNEGELSESDGAWVNTVVARYVEPAQLWHDFAAPVVRDTADILADGKPLEQQLTLRLVRYQQQALRCAEIARRLGRIWGRGAVQLGPRFCELEEGDWIHWTSTRRFNGATKTFRIEAYAIDEKWQAKWTLREIASDVFGEGSFASDQSVQVPSTPPPGIGSPDGASWTLTAQLLASAGASVPALVIAGACEDTSAGAIRFEYWRDDGVINPVTNPDDPEWSSAGVLAPSTTRVEITSITGGAVYYAAVTYTVSGIPGDRLVLGPVTAGTLTSAPTSGSVQASEDIAAHDFVNVYNDGSGNLRVRRADATDPNKFANGFAAAPIANGASGSISFGGINAATVSTPQAAVYLSDATPGAFVATPPATAGHIVQQLGPALPGAGIPFQPQPAVTL